MKKRYTPIITFTVALLLVGSIAYAADKRKKARLAVHDPNELSEETLKVELLAATEDQQKKLSGGKEANSATRTDCASEKTEKAR